MVSQAARSPITEANSVTAASVTSSTRHRAPRLGDRLQERVQSCPAHPPRNGPWTSSCSSRGLSASSWAIGSACGSRRLRPRGADNRPARPRPGPAATPRCGCCPGLAAQEGAVLAILRFVVGGQDVQLVLRGERAPPGPFGHLRVRSPRRLVGHPTSIAGTGRRNQSGRRVGHERGSPSPPSGSAILREQVPRPTLTERARPPSSKGSAVAGGPRITCWLRC